MEAHFEKDYYQDLLSWEELECLINIRPLMTSEKVKIIAVSYTHLTLPTKA